MVNRKVEKVEEVFYYLLSSILSLIYLLFIFLFIYPQSVIVRGGQNTVMRQHCAPIGSPFMARTAAIKRCSACPPLIFQQEWE
jgi:hypothetical protein